MSRVVIFVVTFVLFAMAPAQASLIPIDWDLSTTVRTTQDIQFAFFETPSGSFFDSHVATLDGSVSSATYAISILASIADYQIQVHHSCVNQNNNYPRCSSQGRIILTPSVDTLLTSDMTYAYFMPTDPMDVQMTLTAIAANPTTPLLGQGRQDHTDLTGPHAGSFEIHANTILPANRMVAIQYQVFISFSNGSANGLTGTGDGTIHFTMTELPEPGSLALLAFAALPLLRRRRPAIRS